MPRQACQLMAGPTSQDVDHMVTGGLQRLTGPQILSFGVSSHTFDVDLTADERYMHSSANF